MSTQWTLRCETDEVDGPELRASWQAKRVSLLPKVGTHDYHHTTGEEHEAAAQKTWLEFLADHEFCHLRLRWS